MRKRVRTLLIPYLIACFFFLVTYLVIELIPGCSGFVNSESPFSDNLNLPVGQLLYYLFIDCGGGIPFAFHLWFLRDLIIIVAVSPLLYLLRKSDINKYVVCGIMFGLTFLKIPYLPTFGIFWFMFGGCFLDKLSKVKYRNSLSIMYLLLCIMELTFPEWGGQFLVFRIPIILVGVVCMWLWYDKLIPENFDFSKYGWVKTICGFTFFIYLYHEPTINIVRKILVIPFGHNSLNFAFCYLISPWAFILLFIPIGILMKKYIPSLYGPLVGGR